MNLKLANIDTDRVTFIVQPVSQVKSSLSLYQSTEYVLAANCYSSSWSNTAATFTPTDSWSLYIGDMYQSNSAPVVTITDQSKWNQAADYSLANVEAGIISCRINTCSSELSVDLANLASKQYQMEIWVQNDNSENTLICDSVVFVYNSVEA